VQVGSATHVYGPSFTAQAARLSSGSLADFANVLATQSAAVTKPDPWMSFAALTADDREVIRVATGITLAKDGSVAENATGEFPDWGTILQINHDREEGLLQGSISSGYIKALMDRTPLEMQEGAHWRNLNTAMDFLLKRESGAPVTARTDIVA
jgi:hypothetical protein